MWTAFAVVQVLWVCDFTDPHWNYFAFSLASAILCWVSKSLDAFIRLLYFFLCKPDPLNKISQGWACATGFQCQFMGMSGGRVSFHTHFHCCFPPRSTNLWALHFLSCLQFMYCFKGLFMWQHQETPFYIEIITKCIISLTFTSVTSTEQSMFRQRQFNFKASLMHLAKRCWIFYTQKFRHIIKAQESITLVCWGKATLLEVFTSQGFSNWGKSEKSE